jgi:hypothetical protein
MIAILATINNHSFMIFPMHLHKIPRPPTEITRDDFLTKIFELGRLYEYGYDTIVGAVELADRFMLITEPRQSCYSHEKLLKLQKLKQLLTIDQQQLLTTPIAQIYSKELVVVVLTLAGKVNEDDSYGILLGLEFCANYYIVKMELEIAQCFHYHIRVNNFITHIGSALNDEFNHPKLGPVFGELAKDVCKISQWWNLSPLSIIMGTMLLFQRNNLRAITTNKKNIFHKFISTIAEECEQPLSETLQTYINCHK